MIPAIQSRGQTVGARIAGIATHLPERVLSNEHLAELYPAWPSEKIFDKTGIRERRVAAEHETAGDLAFHAAERLFAAGDCVREDIDFLILCTQAADYLLPTTACLLQDRLGLGRHVGALDVNLGCSGFVYGLALATGLIAAGAARNVLLLTADTYSKFIHERDRSVRTLFGDGAAATLITASSESVIGPFVFGTDGAGGKDLIVEAGGFRMPRGPETGLAEEDSHGNVRSREHLYMNGASVMSFSLQEVPRAFTRLLETSGIAQADVDYVVLHQANKLMLDALQRKMNLPAAKVPRHYEDIGNTVSSTIPFVLADMRDKGQMAPGRRFIVIGFGVGLSWAGASFVC
ncbi:beta-ketoacyl-acyl-carrier-protein synthase I [Methylorubrum populi]|uniref:Beta-ketoacyl-acyl-carrier-protein synthase I n=1 Tax=Methylorubrum populi TaxID=223967 RepID=A0A160PIR3_9HYPH|nr:ketoacyl-ACP synthase III [Methylorubrum populi]BAU91590.1 beta-ketoacyl-acyl-carrier-protein synthase I [Methylorubrum populi]